MSGPSVKELARTTDPIVRRIAGMVRRVVVGVTSSPVWRLIGVRTLEGTSESIEAEAFPGIGFYARPRTTGGKPEAIIVNVGDARAPIVIASRDEKTCAAVREAIGGLEAGEAMVFAPNGGAVIHVKADGTVHVKTPSGMALPLATLADVQELRSWVSAQFAATGGHTHVVSGAATTTIATVSSAVSPPTNAAPSPNGTSVLKGE